jgi:hypothetical protein
MPATPPAAEPDGLSPEKDAEVASARAVFRELDKCWRATRTYGLANSVTRRFFAQLQTLLMAHLEEWPALAVIVDRAELRLHGESVHGSEDSLGESLAFRLFGDGVRELRIDHGVSPEDLDAFLDALWARDDAADVDDDVVTRLWSKDLSTITVVTAEDILQAPWSPELAPQEHGFFSAPPASFGNVLERERKLMASATTASGEGPAAAGQNLRRDGGGLVGFEVSEAERKELARQVAAESAVEASGLLLAMLRAILFSEKTPDVLTRALAVVPAVLDTLLAAGRWPALVEVLDTLETAPGANSGMEPTHRILAQRVLESINLPQRVALIETGLKAAPEQLSGLSGVFARLNSSAVAPLCAVLGTLADEEHRAALRDTLIRLGAETPEPVLKGLADPRPDYVLDLVTIIVAWQLPQAAGVLSMLAHHPSAAVRTEALANIARLYTKGDGAPVLAFVKDADREVRLHALRLLASGRYTASFEAWSPQLGDPEALAELPRAEKRLLFHALRVTAADGAVPLWQEMVCGRGWKQRQKREEAALLALKELVVLGTPRAWEAVDAGRKEASGAVRKACTAALVERKAQGQ